MLVKADLMLSAPKPWLQPRVEQLIHAAFALGTDYERAITRDDVTRISEKLTAILDEARSMTMVGATPEG